MPDFRCRMALLLSLMMVLVACSRGPDEAAARSELQARLDQYFERELFRVHSFSREGSAAFRDVEAGTSGLFIYYNAELEFKQNYNLTAWRGLNLGTLAYVLGATEQGVAGYRAKGNARGDMLRVQGRLAYQQDDQGEWLIMKDGSGIDPTPMEPSPDGSALGPEAVLSAVRAMVAAPPSALTGKTETIVTEFTESLSRIDLHFARNRGETTLGGGPRGGTYQGFSDVFSEYAKAQGFPVHSYASQGSMDNASRVQAGSLEFALVQSDAAQLLYDGWVEKQVLPSLDLRAVASLWPEAVHLVTLNGSGIDSVADLEGRRLAIGLRGSGTRLNALVLGLEAGLGEKMDVQILEIGRERSIALLEKGEIDALFLTEAVPAPSLQRLARRRKDIKLVPIDGVLVEQLSERFFPYYPLVVKARTYPWQDRDYVTLGLTAVMMTNQHVTDEKVLRMLELLHQGVDELSRSYYRAAFITRETMHLGVAVPLHSAAKKFYAQTRINKEPESEAGTEEVQSSIP